MPGKKFSKTIGDLHFHGIAIEKNDNQKLLGVLLEHKLNFEEGMGRE